MTKFLFLRKMRQNLLPLFSVYLFCCHPALSQQLATEEDFPEVDVVTSADGRYSVFSENEYLEPPNRNFQSSKLYLRDSSNDTTLLVYTGAHFMLSAFSASNANLGPKISANGKFIAFRMIENGYMELYRHNIDNGETIHVSTDGNAFNMGGVHIGPNGRYLTYVRAGIPYLYDSLDSSLTNISNSESCATTGSASAPGLSPNGQYVAYVYTCGERELFLYDIDTGTNTQIDAGGVSVRSGEVFISENSQYVRFNAPGAVPGHVYDRLNVAVYPFGTSAECIDSDGDGWGFNEFLGESCAVEQLIQSTCDYSNADLFEGWGWNAATSQSCAPLENVSNTQATAQCMDTDGDGWGWDGVATCVVDAGNPATSTSTDSNCDYSDAHLFGGWGWNANASQSCAPLESVSNTQSTTQCIDTDGDGWGWNGTESCIP